MEINIIGVDLGVEQEVEAGNGLFEFGGKLVVWHENFVALSLEAIDQVYLNLGVTYVAGEGIKTMGRFEVRSRGTNMVDYDDIVADYRPMFEKLNGSIGDSLIEFYDNGIVLNNAFRNGESISKGKQSGQDNWMVKVASIYTPEQFQVVKAKFETWNQETGKLPLFIESDNGRNKELLYKR